MIKCIVKDNDKYIDGFLHASMNGDFIVKIEKSGMYLTIPKTHVFFSKDIVEKNSDVIFRESNNNLFILE